MRRKRKSADPASSRKALQLCHQVADTLNQVLSGECGDRVLRDLLVVSVVLAPITSQLLVRVASAIATDCIEPADAQPGLEEAAGMPPSAVARAHTPRGGSR